MVSWDRWPVPDHHEEVITTSIITSAAIMLFIQNIKVKTGCSKSSIVTEELLDEQGPLPSVPSITLYKPEPYLEELVTSATF